MPAIAPIFRTRKVVSTPITLPNELVCCIAHMAAAASTRTAKAIALTCRALCHEVDAYRFRAMIFRYPRHYDSAFELQRRKGNDYILRNVRAVWWDCVSLLDKDPNQLPQRALRQFIQSTTNVTVLALPTSLYMQYQDFRMDILMRSMCNISHLLITHDECNFDQDVPALRLPHRLTHLFLHNFDPDRVPTEIVRCTSMTHLAITVTHDYDPEADDGFRDVTDLFIRNLLWRCDGGPQAPLSRVLFILMENSDEPGFPCLEQYADAVGDVTDRRIRVRLDTMPCDSTKLWWQSTCQGRTGPDFWDGVDPSVFSRAHDAPRNTSNDH